MNIKIIPCTTSHIEALGKHFARLRAESGRNGNHFMPFAPNSPEGPRGPDQLKLNLPLHVPGWERCFIALDPDNSAAIIGHVDLKGGRLATEMHRCVLGIGIEEAYCNQGLGTALMHAAISYAQGEVQLAWIELGVFSSNLRARALYKKMGFAEFVMVPDRFRIDGAVIDDVMMLLKLNRIISEQ